MQSWKGTHTQLLKNLPGVKDSPRGATGIRNCIQGTSQFLFEAEVYITKGFKHLQQNTKGLEIMYLYKRYF